MTDVGSPSSPAPTSSRPESKPSSNAPGGPMSFGHDVLGPVVAEFCAELWSVCSLMEEPDATVLGFCARGGLRLLHAYETFLSATGLASPVAFSPLMVSRLAALWPAVVRSVDAGLDTLLPAAATTTSYEFRNDTVAGAARRLSGVEPLRADHWCQPFDPSGLVALLGHRDGRDVADVVRWQAGLFSLHVERVLDGRHSMALVDTGLLGTTGWLMTEGYPHLAVGSLMFARSRFRPTSRDVPTFGLSLDATGYSPWERRSALLRHWHYIEWLFEPELPSVTSFEQTDGGVRSNLEVPGWSSRLPGRPGTAFAGIMSYLEGLEPRFLQHLGRDADVAWSRLRQVLVAPRPEDPELLAMGARTHGLGSDESWGPQRAPGVVSALRGSVMWREGEIARMGRLRRPTLTAVEAAYVARLAVRRLRSVTSTAPLPSGAMRRRPRGDENRR